MATYTDGYGGDVFTAQDTLLNNAFPENNIGGHAELEINSAQPQVAIMRLNLSAIVAAAICLTAKLYLYKNGDASNTTNTVSVYSIAAANAAWVEGTGDIRLAAAGEACYEALAADGAGGVTTAWAGTAGLGTADTDYEMPAIGSMTGNWSGDAVGTEYIIDLTAARIEGWFGASNTNYGLLLKSSNGALKVGSAENGTTGYRPKLVVTYAIPLASRRSWDIPFLQQIRPRALRW